ncbi:MAG: NADH-quinone oxidoreductase subunit NuoG [Caldilineaceae bacterium]|nr:NADH-quinone oxidoreductase subunit NuoG [Caldilineaceae bacterium]
MITGHTYREFRFNNITHRNQDLGPFLNHEMNRCIACYRCVRYYRDYAGGRDFNVFGAHDHVYFGRYEDGPLESEFSGNLVEICPTGVFTDKTFKHHYTRKWDLQMAPSICVHCSLGCNTLPGERYAGLRRIRNRYNNDVNGYFLCDRGRYGYEFVNAAQRIRQPLLRSDNGTAEPAPKETVMQRVASILAEGNGVIGIGSPRATLEANFALRTLVSSQHFFTGVGANEHAIVAQMLDILQQGPARSPSLHEIAQADAVLVLGEDVTNSAPLVAMALREAVRQQPMQLAQDLKIPLWQDASVREALQGQTGPLFIATPAHTKLDEVATRTYRADPAAIARLGFAVAHALDGNAPAVADLPAEVGELATEIVRALRTAKHPLVVAGASLRSSAIVQAAANVAWALGDADNKALLCFTVPECNSLGLGLMGGGDLSAAVQAVHKGEADTVIVLENDLYRQADGATVDALLEGARHVIMLDHLPNATTEKAEIVLPAATFAEGDGTLVNNEGRAQRFYQVFVPAGEVQESWRWLGDILAATHSAAANSAATWQSLDDVTGALAQALPRFREITTIAPPVGFRVAGQKIPRQPHRYSGRTAMHANITLHEPKPPDDPDSALAFSMEGFMGEPPPALIHEFWVPGWNSVQAVNKFQSEVGGPLHGGDPGRRLIEPAQGGKTSYFGDVPAAYKPQDGQYLVVSLYHLFGSEPLSLYTPGIAELAPHPYVAMHPDDAKVLGVGNDTTVELKLNDMVFPLPVKLDESLPRAVVGVPAGLPDSAVGALLGELVAIAKG